MASAPCKASHWTFRSSLGSRVIEFSQEFSTEFRVVALRGHMHEHRCLASNFQLCFDKKGADPTILMNHLPLITESTHGTLQSTMQLWPLSLES